MNSSQAVGRRALVSYHAGLSTGQLMTWELTSQSQQKTKRERRSKGDGSCSLIFKKSFLNCGKIHIT